MNNRTDFIEHIAYPRKFLRFSRYVHADIDKLLIEIRAHAGKGLHLGCGNSLLPGIINCDLYNPNADLQVDSTDLSMFADNTIDLIESHHMIEHLSFSDTAKAMTEWNRVLRPGGLLIITCPDLTRICRKWIMFTILYPFFPLPEKLDYIVKMMVGSQEHDGMFHKNSFDERRLSRLLADHGFKKDFSLAPYPYRPTPSLLMIARKNKTHHLEAKPL
ncbi:MAG: methyltransferase domain-containing protein [Syntrophales bacterium]|nr:methyltransferase domain-containing protein [Syntrophales bacterium]